MSSESYEVVLAVSYFYCIVSGLLLGEQFLSSFQCADTPYSGYYQVESDSFGDDIGVKQCHNYDKLFHGYAQSGCVLFCEIDPQQYKVYCSCCLQDTNVYKRSFGIQNFFNHFHHPVDRNIWLKWKCRYCGACDIKYGKSWTQKLFKVKHSGCKLKTGKVLWIGCSESAKPLLCDKMRAEIEANTSEMSYDTGDHVNEMDKENVGDSRNVKKRGRKRKFTEMKSDSGQSQLEQYKAHFIRENKRKKILRPCRMGERNFTLNDNCHLLLGEKQEYAMDMEYIQDHKPTSKKIDALSKANSWHKPSLKKRYAKNRKEQNKQLPPGGQRDNVRKYDTSETAQEIDGRSTALKYCDSLPKNSWF